MRRCDRAMLSYPHTVLRKRLAEARQLAREAQARGRGRTRDPAAVTRRVSQSQSACPSTARGAGIGGLDGLPRAQTPPCVGCMAVGGRRIPAGSRAAPGSRALLPEVPRHGSRAQAVWRCSMPETARARVGAQETQGWAFVRLLLHPGQRRWPGRVPAEAQRGGFSKGPWEVGVAPRVPRRPPALAPGCLRTLDEATRRRQILPPWASDRSGAWRRARRGAGWCQGPGRCGQRDRGWASCGCAVVRRKSARACSLCASEVRRARSPSRGCGTATASQRSATPARWALEASVLPISGRVDGLVVLCTGAQRSARWRIRGGRRRSRARVARLSAGEPEACGSMPPRSSAAHLVGIALGVCGLAAVHGLHGESLPQHAGEACCGPAVGEPVPGAETRDGHDHAVTRGRHSLEKRCRRGCAWCGGAALRPRGARCRRPYSGHASRYRSKRGAEWWRIALRSPPRSCVAFSQGQHTTGVCCGGGLNHYQGHAGDGLQRPLVPRSRCPPHLKPGVRLLKLHCMHCLKNVA